MSEGALEFWREWKPTLMAMCDRHGVGPNANVCGLLQTHSEQTTFAVEQAQRIKELERIAEQSSIAAMQARQDERTARSYLADVRRIVGGNDFPDMVQRVADLASRAGG